MLNLLNRVLLQSTAAVLACSAALLPFALGCAGSSSTATAPIPVVTTPPTPATVTDVYVAGVDFINGVFIATVWKNGIETQIGAPGLMSYANGIVLVGSDMYVAGGQSDGTNLKPVLWKNGVASMLPALAGYGDATASRRPVQTCMCAATVEVLTAKRNRATSGRTA